MWCTFWLSLCCWWTSSLQCSQKLQLKLATIEMFISRYKNSQLLAMPRQDLSGYARKSICTFIDIEKLRVASWQNRLKSKHEQFEGQEYICSSQNSSSSAKLQSMIASHRFPWDKHMLESLHLNIPGHDVLIQRISSVPPGHSHKPLHTKYHGIQ